MYTANCSNASRLLCPTTIVSCRVLLCIVLFYATSSVASPPSIPPPITHVLVSRMGSALDILTYERLLRPSIFMPSSSILSFLHVSPRRLDLVFFPLFFPLFSFFEADLEVKFDYSSSHYFVSPLQLVQFKASHCGQHN